MKTTAYGKRFAILPLLALSGAASAAPVIFATARLAEGRIVSNGATRPLAVTQTIDSGATLDTKEGLIGLKLDDGTTVCASDGVRLTNSPSRLEDRPVLDLVAGSLAAKFEENAPIIRTPRGYLKSSSGNTTITHFPASPGKAEATVVCSESGAVFITDEGPIMISPGEMIVFIQGRPAFRRAMPKGFPLFRTTLLNGTEPVSTLLNILMPRGIRDITEPSPSPISPPPPPANNALPTPPDVSKLAPNSVGISPDGQGSVN